jgi:hypothetical protein
LASAGAGGVRRRVEAFREFDVAPGSGVLVAVGGGPGAVPEAGHDLPGGGALLSEEGSGGMAQVVRVVVGASRARRKLLYQWTGPIGPPFGPVNR